METVDGKPLQRADQVWSEFCDEVSVCGCGPAKRSIDVDTGWTESRRGKGGDDGAAWRSCGHALETTGQPGRVRIAHQVVCTGTDGHQRWCIRQEGKERQLLVDDVGAVGSTAAEIDDRMATSSSSERSFDSRDPAVVERRGTDSLRRRISEYDPDRRSVGRRSRRLRDLGSVGDCARVLERLDCEVVPCSLDPVDRSRHGTDRSADVGQQSGEWSGLPWTASCEGIGDRVPQGDGLARSLRHVILVDVESVSMSRPNRPLFSDVSVTVASGDRLGVVGINGTGKSTLLSIIAGTCEPEGGDVRRGRGVTVAAVDQVTTLPSGSVRSAVGADWRGEAVIDRLGLADVIDRPTEELSGGQEKRVALARALVADADLLVLDEPTNHLDVDAIEWLENELAQFSGGLVVVTHDRAVLDRLATRVLELDRGSAYTHDGGYAGYLEGRAAREERAAAHEKTRQNLARRELAWLRRGPKARTSKSRARVERATDIVTARPQAAARAGDLDLAALHDGTPRLGDQVIELHDVVIGFDPDAPLIEGLDLLLDRRERLGIVGANGSGKSTLLDVIAGRRDPLAGSRVEGSTVRVGLHDQQGRALDPKLRVRQTVAGDGAEPDWWDIALLERFWFDTDAQWAPIELLSGGERRRLQLVVTLAAKPNVLLLDEPTNDLDLDTLRALEDFLEDWPGAVVVISHDRSFLDRTVDDVIVIDDGRAQRWPGGYAGWLAQRAPASARTLGSSASVRPSSTSVERSGSTSGRSRSTVRHELKVVENDIAKAERDVEELRQALAAAADHLELARVGAALATREAELVALEEVWLERTTELDEIDGHA